MYPPWASWGIGALWYIRQRAKIPNNKWNKAIVGKKLPIPNIIKLHEANRGPWKILEDVGVIIKEVNLLDDGMLDYKDFKNKITNKTVLIAMGMSSSAIGTLNDFNRVNNFIKNK